MGTLNARRERIEQLAAVLDGSLPEADARGDVRRLATLASTVASEIELPRLEDAERDRIRTRVMAAVHTDLQAAAAPQTTRSPRTARTALATGVASVLIGTGGVAVAAQEALPGDVLYGIKQATESVRLAAAGDLTEQGRLELALAVERLGEVTAAVDRGDVRDQDLIDTLGRMDARSWSGSETLVRVAERSGEPELIEEVARFTEQQARGIVDVFDRLPVEVRPHAEDSLAMLRAIRADLLGPALGDPSLGSAELAAIESLLRSSPLPAPRPVEASPATSSSSGSTGDVAGGGSDPGGPLQDTESVVPLPGTDTATSGGDGPLADLGETVEDAVDGVTGGGKQLIDAVTDPIEDAVDDPVGTVKDPVDKVKDAVDGVVDGTRDAVDGIVGKTPGPLGGTSTD